MFIVYVVHLYQCTINIHVYDCGPLSIFDVNVAWLWANDVMLPAAKNIIYHWCLGGAAVRRRIRIERSLVRLTAGALSSQLSLSSLWGR